MFGEIKETPSSDKLVMFNGPLGYKAVSSICRRCCCILSLVGVEGNLSLPELLYVFQEAQQQLEGSHSSEPGNHAPHKKGGPNGPSVLASALLLLFFFGVGG